MGEVRLNGGLGRAPRSRFSFVNERGGFASIWMGNRRWLGSIVRRPLTKRAAYNGDLNYGVDFWFYVGIHGIG